jgi:galactokinase
MANHTYHVRSPGRVNLVGGHTDYAGGHVLPFATDLHTRLDATPDDRVTVRSEALGEQRSFDPADREPTGSWVDYVKGCYAVLAEAGYTPGGFTGELAGTLPLGSGLSSSASLELAVLALLNEAYDLGMDRERMARLGQRVENDFVGVSCGLLDQYAVALGRAGHALSVDTATLDYEPVPVPDRIGLVVYHTGVTHELADSAYNERRATVEAALDAVGVDSVQAVGADELDALPDEQNQRLGYVVRENERVGRATAALRDGDLEALGEVLVRAHRDLAANYEASCPELDHVVEAALDQGAYGARLTGAGWGGAAVALVDVADADEVARSVHDVYRDRYPEHDARSYLVTSSDGVSVERTGR